MKNISRLSKSLNPKLIIVAIALLGVFGVTAYSTLRGKNESTSPSSPNSSQQTKDLSSTANDVASAPEVSSVNDLDKAEAMLDQTDPAGSNNSDANQLDGELVDF